MMPIDTDAIESLRSFAEQHGELQFAHLCTAALQGEEWAAERLDVVLHEWCFAPCDEDRVLELVQDADCTRPDGAIARSIEV